MPWLHQITSQALGRIYFLNQEDEQNKKDKNPSWQDLMMSTGSELWNGRKRALVHKSSNQVPTRRKSNGNNSSSTSSRTTTTTTTTTKQVVCVLSSPLEFARLEREGMSKFQGGGGGGGRPGGPKALTQCTGEEWIHQRACVLKALQNIPNKSLQAVEFVEFESIAKSRRKADLKQVSFDASLGWVVRLFRGKEDTLIETKLAKYWATIRARKKHRKSIQSTYQDLAQCLSSINNNNDHGGILECLTTSGLTREEATVNAIFAMIAAFDACQNIVFWTIWNLSRTDGAWSICRNELMTMNDNNRRNDLDLLASFKQQATQGQRVSLMGMSYLCRALAETVRVYPPVWTLPRNNSGNNCPFRNDIDNSQGGIMVVGTHLDVPSTNGALDRKWDPDRTDDSCIASFGLGERHCPAGTAALFAAYTILQRFVIAFSFVKECTPNNALKSIYLGPTLCLQGPQRFKLES